MPKEFRIPGVRIQRLIEPMGSCFASDRITVDGCPVGWMYREVPDDEHDSGWRFFAGDEPDAYCDDPDRFGVYDVNTICNYDHAIISCLGAPVGSAFERTYRTSFRRVRFDVAE